MPHTVRLHRVLRTTPERLYRAFLDADAIAKWLPPDGFTGKVHALEARVGGRFKMSFTNFASGSTHSFGGGYLELVAHERLRYTDVFDDPNLPGVIHVTVTFKRVVPRSPIPHFAFRISHSPARSTMLPRPVADALGARARFCIPPRAA